MPKLGLLSLGAGLAAGLTFAPSPAQACREHCQIRGGIRVALPPFGVNVRWPRGHIVIRGPILGFGVGDYGPPPPPPPPPMPPMPPEPPEPPMPPEPPTYYTPAPAPEAPTAVYEVARPRDPTIGVGVRASALRIGRDGPEAAGYGVLLRFRARPVELELEVGRDSYQDDVAREDTRLGASLYVPLVQSSFAPFLVVGAGMNFSHFEETGDELHQGYVAGGGGLSLKLGRRFVLSADARYMLRGFFDAQDKIDLQPTLATNLDGDSNRDQAVELRLNGVLYF